MNLQQRANVVPFHPRASAMQRRAAFRRAVRAIVAKHMREACNEVASLTMAPQVTVDEAAVCFSGAVRRFFRATGWRRMGQ